MDEYIKKSEVVDYLQNLALKSGNESMEFSLGWAAKHIKEMPAENVREIVRGKWAKKGKWYCCSICGHDMIFTGTYDDEQRYCSYCGNPCI